MPIRTLVAAVLAIIAVPDCRLLAREYAVGPDQEFLRLEQTPFERLAAGDVVSIHWRPEPYRAKWVVAARGTAEQPIVIRGVPGPEGQLPIIDAEGAVTGPQLDFWSGARGIIKIGGSNNPPDVMPAWIVIEGLELRGARPGRNFFGREGLAEYSESASAIYVERGEHITIRSCRLHDCANGFFSAHDSAHVLVEGCDIFGNGVEGSAYQHNNYTQSAGITFQFNRFGPLRDGCGGSNLKDRSSGTIIRYNLIEGGNRQIDLVEAQEGTEIRARDDYHVAFVYGNVLIERDGDGNNQIAHFGGDSGPEDDFRRGPLWFFHNTVLSRRNGTTTLLRLSTAVQRAEVFNNLVLVDGPGTRLAILGETGSVRMHHNGMKPGWKRSHDKFTGQVLAESNIEVDLAVVRNFAAGDFRLSSGSAAQDRGLPHPPDVADHPVKWQLGLPVQARKRPDDGRPDLGAVEFSD
ncbi:MAG: right-handed parallel beta-helix repeat-containing protein [Planctomyces sp.]|nr:right-handed parallel beta-helix repeat-containing protein [Planctomyces sp.]